MDVPAVLYAARHTWIESPSTPGPGNLHLGTQCLMTCSLAFLLHPSLLAVAEEYHKGTGANRLQSILSRHFFRNFFYSAQLYP